MNIVETVDLRRTYGEGETAVHALRRLRLAQASRVREARSWQP